MTTTTLRSLIEDHVDQPGFVNAVMSGPANPGERLRAKITMRKVLVKGQNLIQVTRYIEGRAFVENVGSLAELQPPLDPNLYRHLVVRADRFKVEARVTNRGGVVSTKSEEANASELSHDRAKPRLVPQDARFLEVLGLASSGAVKPNGQSKYRQIDQFLHAIINTPGAQKILQQASVSVVDFGCGTGYLTFAIYYYLTTVLGLECSVTGIDRNRELIDRSQKRARDLGWTGLTFACGDIADAHVLKAPDIVVGLHACDTATDDVLLRAIQWRSPVVLVSPCCHHHIQAQMSSAETPDSFRSIIRHGLLKERLGDVLTDGMRCDLLKLLGYQTEAMEFVSLEHTAKNLLIRAGHTHATPQMEDVQRYVTLRDEWGVEPYLEGAIRAANHEVSDRLKTQLSRVESEQ